MTRAAQAKPLRVPLYLGDEARADRLAAIAERFGTTSESEALRVLIDLAAAALGIPSPLSEMQEHFAMLMKAQGAMAALQGHVDALAGAMREKRERALDAGRTRPRSTSPGQGQAPQPPLAPMQPIKGAGAAKW